MIFTTSLDKRAVILTVLVTVVFLFIIVMQYPIITDHMKDGAFYTTLTCLFIYFLAFGFRPVKYKIKQDEIEICRPLLNARIRRSEVLHAEVIGSDVMHGAIRTWGVGGLWGYYGNFYSFTLGRMTWYATRKDKVVLLKTEKDNIILTPDDPEMFVENIMSRTA